jgi:hypothetical protein
MNHKLAASLALVAFAGCLVIGAFSARNTFTTTVLRALAAMGGMYVLGLVLGAVASSGLGRPARANGEKSGDSGTRLEENDR